MTRLGLSGTPIKHLAREVRELNLDLAEDNLLSLSYGRVVRKDISSNEGLLPESFERYTKVRAGDTVLRLTDLQNDQRSLRTGRVSEAGIITSAYLSLRPSNACDSRFLAYCLHAMDVGKVFYALGGGLRQSMGMEEVGNLRIPLPPLDEQRRIADFLDDQITRIDSIVDLRLQQVLASEREFDAQVTNDLAGIPQDRATPLRRLLSGVRTGSTPNEDVMADGLGIPWYTPASISPGGSLGSPVRLLPRDMERSDGVVYFKPKSVLLVGIGATAGRVALLDHTGAGNQQLTALEPNDRLDWTFLYFQLKARSQQLLESAPFTTLPIINNDTIRAFGVLAPPLAVQRDLTKNWLLEAARSEITSAQLREGADLLLEYKRSLVTAAVTGELDVSTAGSGVPA